MQIIKVIPYRSYQQIGVLDVHGFADADMEGMDSVIRKQAAAMGGDAVIINDSGITVSQSGSYERWAKGVIIHYNPNADSAATAEPAAAPASGPN